jgi:hypothetical protein
MELVGNTQLKSVYKRECQAIFAFLEAMDKISALLYILAKT